ncbi:MAG: hypothetical protein ACRDQF_17855, partial [Thermocrispum sp.]
VGWFPGLREAQRLAVRDEVRHIGIGVSYARRRLTSDGARARGADRRDRRGLPGARGQPA